MSWQDTLMKEEERDLSGMITRRILALRESALSVAESVTRRLNAGRGSTK